MSSALPVPAKPPMLSTVVGVAQLAISRDGTHRATTDTDLVLHMHRDGERVWSRNLVQFGRPASNQRVRALTFDERGEMIVVAFNDTLQAIDTATGKTIWEYTPPRSFGFLVVTPLSVSAGEGRIVASFDNGTVAQWTPDGKMIGVWHANDAPRQLAVVNEEIVGTDSFSLTRWSLGSRVRKSRVRMPERVYGFSASAHRPIAATRTLHYVYVWDLEEGKSLGRIPVGTGLPLVTCHPSADYVVLSGADTVNVHTFTGELVAEFNLNGDRPLSLTISPDGGKILVGTATHRVLTFDWPNLG
jgi:outer membrane protein assembly factor BamB